MLGSTVLSIERRQKTFHLFFAESSIALVGRGVLAAKSNPNCAPASRAGNSRPCAEAPSHNLNTPRRQKRHPFTLAALCRDGERTLLERSHAIDTQKSKTL